jgi:hypothetical protein
MLFLTKGSNHMTILEAAALRVKWNLRADQSKCEHRNLELEWNDLGHSTGHYTCIICGEPVGLNPLVPREAHLIRA